MTLLVIDRADVRLECEGSALIVRDTEDNRTVLPLRQITRAVLQGARMKVDLAVLQKLAEHGATTLILSARRSRRVAVVIGNPHNDATLRLAQALSVVDLAQSLIWSRAIVTAKIRRQQRAVAQWLLSRPDSRRVLFRATQTLSDMESKTAKAQSIDSLRGLEGAAARSHYEALACVLPAALGFSGRNRRPPRDPANAALSLGYTLLHTEAVHALHAAGLDPMLGFLHSPQFGRESLASDLMEPLRPSIDLWLWRLFADRRLQPEHFTIDGEACLLGKAGRTEFYSAWAGYRAGPAKVLERASRRLALSLRNSHCLINTSEGQLDVD